MRARQHQGIDPLRDQRLQVFPQHLLRHLFGNPVLLDQRHQQRGRDPVYHQPALPRRQLMLVGMGLDGSTCCNDPDPLRVLVRQHRLHPGLDHPHDGHRAILPEFRQGMRCRRIARHNDRLHPFGKQEIHILFRKLAYRLRTLGAIRQTRRIAKIDDILTRQKVLHRPHHGQPTHTRIEKSQSSFLHGGDSLPPGGIINPNHTDKKPMNHGEDPHPGATISDG